MDFFASQDHARKQTRWLVALYVFTVVLIILSIYGVVAYSYTHYIGGAGRHEVVVGWWFPDIFLWTTVGVLVIVVGASAFKISSLNDGGASVAKALGGTRVSPDTRDADERKLMNVVEEMSIASGVPMPQVYVLEGEAGINAFAAGYTIHDAAIAVTRGCIETLNRDELQGVIAHEFSHILNGDMRLNIRLIGVLFGILVIAIVGREMMSSIRFRSRDKEGNGLAIALLVGGLAIMIIGYIGVFFARLIQCAISRQREFLADASAVQFTRYPDGIGGALIKIGAHSSGSQITHSHAEESSHMYFANGVSALFSTHPPLDIRIRAVLPQWDGKFEVRASSAKKREASAKKESAQGVSKIPLQKNTTELFSGFGALNDSSLLVAQNLLCSVSDPMKDILRNREGAEAFVLVLLLEHDSALREKQFVQIKTTGGNELLERVQHVWESAYGMTLEQRLPMLEIAVSALESENSSSQTILTLAQKLAEVDGVISPFEFCLLRIVRLALKGRSKLSKSSREFSAKEFEKSFSVAASFVTRLGCKDESKCSDILNTALKKIPLFVDSIRYLPTSAENGLSALDEALDAIATASFVMRKQFLQLVMNIIQQDGKVTIAESEFFRAFACGLDCPVAPVISR